MCNVDQPLNDDDECVNVVRGNVAAQGATALCR